MALSAEHKRPEDIDINPAYHRIYEYRIERGTDKKPRTVIYYHVYMSKSSRTTMPDNPVCKKSIIMENWEPSGTTPIIYKSLYDKVAESLETENVEI